MAPVIVKNIFKSLAKPIDLGKSWKGKRILGDHKTWRGLLFGVVFGIATAFVQYLLVNTSFGHYLGATNYDQWLRIGFLLGLGAIVGDSVKSFFKRRSGVKPGGKYMPFDQSDFVIGAILFSLDYWPFSIAQLLLSVAVSILLHIGTNHLAFWLRIRDEAW